MAVGEQLSVGVRVRDDGVAVVRLDGELDLASAPVLEREISGGAVRGAAKVVHGPGRARVHRLDRAAHRL